MDNLKYRIRRLKLHKTCRFLLEELEYLKEDDERYKKILFCYLESLKNFFKTLDLSIAGKDKIKALLLDTYETDDINEAIDRIELEQVELLIELEEMAKHE